MKSFKVNGFPKESPQYSELWSLYNSGLESFKNEKLDEGLKSFDKCFESVVKNKSASAEEFRIAGLCLKKIGWYYRKNKDYHKAYSYHNMRLALVREFGSANEVHDALISLDVDVYMLKNMHLSERYLKESIDYAHAVKDPKSKFMALGTTFNNLGGTLYGLHKFEEAESSILKSLEFWNEYEKVAGKDEMKVPWAYYAIGDVFENWANYLKESEKDYSLQKNKAQSNYIKAQEIATEREMSLDSKKWIDQKVDSIKEL